MISSNVRPRTTSRRFGQLRFMVGPGNTGELVVTIMQLNEKLWSILTTKFITEGKDAKKIFSVIFPFNHLTQGIK